MFEILMIFMSWLYKVSGNAKTISKKSGLTFPFVNFYETLQKFENLSEGLKRNRENFFRLPSCSFLRRQRFSEAILNFGQLFLVLFKWLSLDQFFILLLVKLGWFFHSLLIFAVSATRGPRGRAYLASARRLFGSRKRHKLGTEEQLKKRNVK